MHAKGESMASKVIEIMESKPEYPFISIGIPTYNRREGILRTLTSIWKQEYPNLEIVISDNCSTDNTQEIIEELCKEHGEIRFFRQQSNRGMIPNFEFVLKKSTGKYFMWVSDDDALEPGILFKYVSFLEKHPDYSIVSGVIKYWLNSVPDFNERGFTLEQTSPGIRVFNFYAKVIYGGMIHGMMRRDLANNVYLRRVIGNDYHFIANLAYLGKVKNFEFIGYHKNFGGTSQSFKQYAKAMGDSAFAGNYPHIKMALDAYKEVWRDSTVFSAMPMYERFTLACASFSAVLLCYCVKIFPYAIGGKIKRMITKPFN
jgi:glycosyltransferase involved in cell wall biosynthesis